MAWRIPQCRWQDKATLKAFLRESWEPFAVTETADGPTVWLRRDATLAYASIVDAPRRPRGEPEVTR
jgi:hypothetical protein